MTANAIATPAMAGGNGFASKKPLTAESVLPKPRISCVNVRPMP